MFSIHSNADGSVMFAGTDSGVFRLRLVDSASGWKRVLLPYANYEFAVTYFGGYVFAEDSGSIVRSSDEGDHWTISSRILQPNQAVDCYGIHGTYIFAGTDTSEIFRSDTGKTW